MLRKPPRCCQSLLRKRLRCCQGPAAEAAAALPEPAPEAVAVPPVLPVLGEPGLPACKKARLVPTNVLALLQTGQMLKAMAAYLETLQAQRGIDKLRCALQQWRAAATVVDQHAERSELRQGVATEAGDAASLESMLTCVSA